MATVPQPEGPPAPPEQVEPPATRDSSGLWPSPRLIELMITRWAEEAATEYELDEDQREKVRESTLKRWSDFAAEHEFELQPLLNEFLEMRLGLDPPEKDRVQAWAERALPVFEQMQAELQKTTDDFRSVMRPEQRARLEIEVFKRRTGLQLAENKLRHWSQGNIQPDELWEPLRETRRERRERRQARLAEAERIAESGAEPSGQNKEKAKLPDQIAVELDLWSRYVQGFIAHYELDEAQRTTALSCLSELQERAAAHREAHRDEIAKLETLIAKPDKRDEDQAALKEQLAKLYGPIDAMFQELRARLDATLTTEQRAQPQFEFAPPQPAQRPAGTPAEPPKTERRPND